MPAACGRRCRGGDCVHTAARVFPEGGLLARRHVQYAHRRNQGKQDDEDNNSVAAFAAKVGPGRKVVGIQMYRRVATWGD